MKKNVFTIVLIIFALCSVFAGCSVGGEDFFALGTEINVKIKGSPKAYKKILAQLALVEAQLSTTVPTSDVSKINAAPVGTRIEIGNHTATVLSVANQLYDISDGAFNPYIFPLVKLWKFDPDNFSVYQTDVPELQAIEAAKSLCSPLSFSVQVEGEKTFITKTVDGAMLDFGGIAKGYAADIAKGICDEYNVNSALINIGGNIYLYGKMYNVGIRHPRDTANLFASIKLQDTSIVTSGDYERFFLAQDGTRYCHIIDSKTGSPIINSVLGVSVVGSSSMYCDALATALCVVGEDGAAQLLDKVNSIDGNQFSVLIIAQSNAKLQHTVLGDLKIKLYDNFSKNYEK